MTSVYIIFEENGKIYDVYADKEYSIKLCELLRASWGKNYYWIEFEVTTLTIPEWNARFRKNIDAEIDKQIDTKGTKFARLDRRKLQRIP